jgi:ribosomal-protein-alanine N-acetyltransferase
MDIERKVFNEHDPFLYIQFYETCSEGFIVAELNGFVVGYVVGFLASEDTGRIFSIAVNPKFQNRGIGSLLLKDIIDVLRRYGAKEITLEVRTGNIRAKRFYERHGFFQNGFLEKYYSNGEDGIIMKLRLHPE